MPRNSSGSCCPLSTCHSECLLAITAHVRFAIDSGADFSSAQKQVEALAKAKPEEKSRLSTTISVKTAKPAETSKKEKRRESSGHDSKKSKKPKTRD